MEGQEKKKKKKCESPSAHFVTPNKQQFASATVGHARIEHAVMACSVRGGRVYWLTPGVVDHDLHVLDLRDGKLLGQYRSPGEDEKVKFYYEPTTQWPVIILPDAPQVLFLNRERSLIALDCSCPENGISVSFSIAADVKGIPTHFAQKPKTTPPLPQKTRKG